MGSLDSLKSRRSLVSRVEGRESSIIIAIIVQNRYNRHVQPLWRALASQPDLALASGGRPSHTPTTQGDGSSLGQGEDYGVSAPLK